MMRHMSALETEVPTEQFSDRKCTFLELFQVPGTPIFLKICRELGEHVGDMAGRSSSQGEVANRFPIKLMAGRPFLQKADSWPARKRGRPAMCFIRGYFGLFQPLPSCFFNQDLRPIKGSRGPFLSCLLQHFPLQI